MRRRFIDIFIILFLVVCASPSWGGIIIGGTRIIFPSNKTDTTISVINNDTSLPYLIQAWIDPFLATENETTVYRYSSCFKAGAKTGARIAHY